MYIKIGLTKPYWLSMFKSVYSLLVYKDLGEAMLSEKVMIIETWYAINLYYLVHMI